MKKTIILAVLAVLLVGLSGGTGYYIATQMQKDNTSTPVVASNSNNAETIAFVNMDDGVEVDGELINYASTLIDFSSENFEETSLQEAKNGIEDGTYAAYVIIPATFSENVVSLNTTPAKSTIQYEVSQNLSEDSKETALYNIFNFSNTLNNDLSYMYLSSILSEFHTAQSSAQEVIDNDSSDLQVLLNISDIDLVTTINIGELKAYEAEITNLDLSSNYEENEYLISLVQSKYDEYISLGSEDFNQLVAEGESVYDYSELSQLLNSLWTYNDSTGGKVYDSGLSKIDTILDNYDYSEVVANIDKSTGYSEYKNNSGNIDSGSIIDLYLNGKAEAMTYLKGKLTFDANVFGLLENNITTDVQKYLLGQLDSVNGNLKEPKITGIGYEDINIDELYNYLEMENNLIDYLNSNIKSSDTIEDLLDDFVDTYYGKYANWDDFYKSYYQNTDLYNASSTKEYLDGLLDHIEDEYNTGTGNISTIVDQSFKNEIDTNKTVANSISDQIDDVLDMKDATDLNYLTTLQTDSDDTTDTNDEALLKNLELISDKLEPLKDSVNSMKSEVNDAIQNDIIGAMKTSSSNDASTFTIAYQGKTSAVSAYMDGFKLYDPLKYVNQSEINSISSDLSKNNADIERQWNGLISEYIEYAYKSNETASEHVSTLTQTIYDANEKSNQQISSGLLSAKTSRQSTNEENLKLMNDFISKLPYTKLGSGPSAEAYDFIVNPVNFNTDKVDNLTEAQNNIASQTNSNNNDINYIIIIGSAVLALIILISFVAYALAKRKTANESN